MTDLYVLHNKDIFDPEKKTLFLFLFEQGLSREVYAPVFRYLMATAEVLVKRFNIIIVPKGFSDMHINQYLMDDFYSQFMYILFDRARMYENSAGVFPFDARMKYLDEIFAEIEKEEKAILDTFVGCVCSQSFIPALNTNYEIVSDEPKLVEKRESSRKGYIQKMKDRKLVSHTAFIHRPIAIQTEWLFHLMKTRPEAWYYSFCHDTSAAWLHFTSANPWTKNVRCYYFIDDFMDGREFHHFPMSELQEGYKNKLKDPRDELFFDIKMSDFVFGGLFPFEVEYRVDAWYKYFNDLDTTGAIFTQTDGLSKVTQNALDKEPKIKAKNESAKEKIAKFVEDIRNHPMTRPTVDYETYNQCLQDAHFTIILRCYYGKYDSLNFRIVSSLANGCIPLIDEDYDVHARQIPLHLRDKLVVRSAKDIQDKANYYRDNQDRYIELFNELYDHFINEKYYSQDYYNTEFLEYFKEIY